MNNGILAEFRSPDEMVRGLRELRRRGYRRIDAFSPYPIRAAEDAIGLGRSMIGWFGFAIGIVAAGAAYLVQWYCNALDYPLNVGGRPLHSPAALVPVAFEITALAIALAGFVALLVLARLPEVYSPIFNVEGFDRATIDSFWIGIDARDPEYSAVASRQVLKEIGALRVAAVGGESRW